MSTADGYNADILGEQKEKLRQIFPEVFSEDKINWDQLRLTLGENSDTSEKFGLGWKNKSKAFAKIQEKTVNTLHPQPEESVDFDATENMFIEGDNLEALKILHKTYYNKIKMIYIDPPYNTTSDLIYNDTFTKDRHEHAFEEGTVDEDGLITREDGLRVNNGGHRHSNWLDMMYPRLFLARNLLRDDGVIFISIGNQELDNLKKIANEIFGEDNFLSMLIWRKNKVVMKGDKTFKNVLDPILVYARNKNLVEFSHTASESKLSDFSMISAGYGEKTVTFAPGMLRFKANTASIASGQYPNLNLLDDIQVLDGHNANTVRISAEFKWSESKVHEKLNGDAYALVRNTETMTPRIYFEGNRAKPLDYLDDKYNVGTNESAKDELKRLDMEDYFSYPKPTGLIEFMANIVDDPQAIVLDFFAGSATTAHAVSRLNAKDDGARKWIIVQLPELIDESHVAYQAGFKTISALARERVRRSMKQIGDEFAGAASERKAPLDLGFRAYAIGDSNLKKWDELVADPHAIRQQTLDSINPVKDGATDDEIVCELLLKRGIAPIATIKRIDDYYFVPSQSLIINLAHTMTEASFDRMLAQNPHQIIILDQAFQNDLNLKANLLLKAEKQNIIVEVL